MNQGARVMGLGCDPLKEGRRLTVWQRVCVAGYWKNHHMITTCASMCLCGGARQPPNTMEDAPVVSTGGTAQRLCVSGTSYAAAMRTGMEAIQDHLGVIRSSRSAWQQSNGGR